MCTGDNNVLAFLPNFIDNLVGRLSQQWIQQLKHNEIDLFSHNMLVMPFQTQGQQSLFVVVGAKHIKDYMKKGFSKTWPCILHILPYATSTRVQNNAYYQVCRRLRAWLNSLWQATRRNNDFESIQFTNTSLPMTRPFGECIYKTMNGSFPLRTIAYHNECSSLSF